MISGVVLRKSLRGLSHSFSRSLCSLFGRITYPRFPCIAFEGISPKLKHEVGEALNPERDSVRFYVLRTAKYLDIKKLGVPSRPGDAEVLL